MATAGDMQSYHQLVLCVRWGSVAFSLFQLSPFVPPKLSALWPGAKSTRFVLSLRGTWVTSGLVCELLWAFWKSEIEILLNAPFVSWISGSCRPWKVHSRLWNNVIPSGGAPVAQHARLCCTFARVKLLFMHTLVEEMRISLLLLCNLAGILAATLTPMRCASFSTIGNSRETRALGGIGGKLGRGERREWVLALEVYILYTQWDWKVSLFLSRKPYSRSLKLIYFNMSPLQTTMALLPFYLKARDFAPSPSNLGLASSTSTADLDWQPRNSGIPRPNGLEIPSLLGCQSRSTVSVAGSPSFGGTSKIPCLSAKWKQCYIADVFSRRDLVEYSIMHDARGVSEVTCNPDPQAEIHCASLTSGNKCQ